MIRHWIYILSALILLLLLGLLAVSRPQIRSPKVQAIHSEVKHEGDHVLLADRDLREELERLKINPIGHSIDSFNSMEVESQLIRNRLLGQIDVYTTPTGDVYITMQQREPLFIWSGTDQNYFVCKDHTVVPINRTQDYYMRFIPVMGAVNQSQVVYNLYPMIERILANDTWRELFIQIYVDPVRGVIAVPRASSTEIIFGDMGDWDEKFDKLDIFLKKIIPKFGWHNFSSVSLEFKNQIVTIPTSNGTLRKMIPIPEPPIQVDATF